MNKELKMDLITIVNKNHAQKKQEENAKKYLQICENKKVQEINKILNCILTILSCITFINLCIMISLYM